MSECRTVNNDAAVWPIVLVLEGVEVTRTMVPIKEVWTFDKHNYVNGVCTNCGTSCTGPKPEPATPSPNTGISGSTSS